MTAKGEVQRVGYDVREQIAVLTVEISEIKERLSRLESARSASE